MAIVTYKRISLIDALRLSDDKEKIKDIYFADSNNQLIRVDGYKFNLADLQNIKFFEKRLEGVNIG